MPVFSLLTVPWGLAGSPAEKIRLNGPQPVAAIVGGASPLLFAPDALSPRIEGREKTTEIQGAFTDNGGAPQRLHALPVPLRAETPQLLRHEHWKADAELSWKAAVSRPRRQHAEGEEEEPGWPWFRFLLAVSGRMRDFEAALDEAFLPWECVRDRWLAPGEAQDPVMDVLVKHARRHRVRWGEIADRPRRVLNRHREMVPLARVEELDTHCMAWLSRQPGSTIAERGGDRQRILALARYENLNTLENRVFRDLLERSAAAARDYLRLNAGRQRRDLSPTTNRYALVEAYGRECRAIARALAAAGIGRETGRPQPNFVLLQDERYRHVWQAWREIVERETVHDDLWRWQRRSWGEFCKAACAVALLARPRAELIAASPLFFRPEHRRGEWLVHDDPLVIVHDGAKNFVVEVLRGDSADVKSSLHALGASVWLRVANTNGDMHRYVAVWAVQGPTAPPALKDLVLSADNALAKLPKSTGLAAGVVLQALPDPEASVQREAGAKVVGIAFGPGDGRLGDGLAMLGDELAALIAGIL